VSICRFASPRQYAPATDCSLNALIRFVLGACGPRQRSVNGPLVYSETVSTGMGGVGIPDEVLDQLDLVVLALGAEALERLATVTSSRTNGSSASMCSRIFASIAREVRVAERHPVGEVEVVVEAVLDRRPDRDLHPG
jgi:hypothetical protein